MIKTGDAVRDGQGNSYQLGQLLGRGLWGRSWVVRRESDERLYVLKTPLAPEDFRGEVPGAEAFFAACREALLEQGRLYEQARFTFLPRLLDRFTLTDGQPALLVPRFPETLERRMVESPTIGGLVDTLLAVVKLLRELDGEPGFHGNLRPSNVLFNERGEIFLADFATPAVRKHFARLAGTVPGGQPWLPPELAETPAAPWGPGSDTYALAMMLWRGLVAGEVAPPWPRAGLDKAAQLALKDKAIERMKLEDSNPRFHGRLAERTAVLLARALSRETNPSPPYRFPRLDELAARLDEVQQLVRPTVASVGKVMLDRTAAKPWFTTDEDIGFTTTVACTSGVEGQDEIGVGIAVFEYDREQRMRELQLGYSVDRHPSGRYRFAFTIGGLPPGRYRARLAFAIRDSGQPPVTTEAEFQVRAAPGWVPRAEPAVPSPLPLRPDPITVTQTNPDPGLALPGAATARAPAIAVEAPPPNAPPPYTPGPKPGVPGNTVRHGFDDPSITAVPIAGVTAPTAPLPLPVPPPERRAEPRVEVRPEPEPVPEATEPVPPRVEVRRPEPRIEAPRAPVIQLAPLAQAPPTWVEESLDPEDGAEPTLDVQAIAEPPPPPPKPPPPPPEPAWKARDWSTEALPGQAARRPAAEEPEPDPYADEDDEPSPLARVWHQLRTDPYIAVMAGLGAVILVLLLVFLLLRK